MNAPRNDLAPRRNSAFMDACQLVRKETKMEVVHLNQKQLATRWGVSEARLPRWRSEGIGPKFLKLLRPGPLPPDRHRSLRGIVSGDLDQEPWRAGERGVMRVAFCR